MHGPLLRRGPCLWEGIARRTRLRRPRSAMGPPTVGCARRRRTRPGLRTTSARSAAPACRGRPTRPGRPRSAAPVRQYARARAVVVLQQVREHLSPDARRHLQELASQLIEDLGRDVARRRVNNEGPCEVGVDRDPRDARRPTRRSATSPGSPTSVVGDASSTRPTTRSGTSTATRRATRHEPECAGQDRPFDAKRVEQAHDVGGEVLHSIAGHRLVGVAVPTLGHRDRPSGDTRAGREQARRTAMNPSGPEAVPAPGPNRSPYSAYEGVSPLGRVTAAIPRRHREIVVTATDRSAVRVLGSVARAWGRFGNSA